MIDDVIKSKSKKPCKCYVCSKSGTKPYLVPSRDTIEMIYAETKSLEIFKHVKVFWLCNKCFNLFSEMDKDDCSTSMFDEELKNTYSINILDRWDKLFSESANITVNLKNYLKRLRVNS